MSWSPTRPSAVPPLRIPQPVFLANAKNSSERLKLSLQYLHEDVGLSLNRTLELDGEEELFITSIMGKDFGDRQHSKLQSVEVTQNDNHHDTCNLDFKLELPASIFTPNHPLSRGLSEVLDDVEWTKPRNDVLGNKDHVWTSSKMAFSPKRTTFDSASGHEEPLFSRGAQLRSLSALHRQKLGNIMRRIGSGSDSHSTLADRASEINEEASRQQQHPLLQILTPSDKMIRQIQADRRMPTGQIEVNPRKPYPREVAKSRTTGAMFKFHDDEGARTLVNEIVLQHQPQKIRPAPRAPSDRPHGVKMGGGFRPVTVFPDHDEEILASTMQTGLSLVPYSSGLRPQAPAVPVRTPRGFNVKKSKPARPNTFFV